MPYGKSYQFVEIPINNLQGVFKPQKSREERDIRVMIRDALKNPIAMKKLNEIVSANDTIGIAITDRTRETPNNIILPELLKRLNAIGVKTSNVKIIVGTGLHDPDDEEEIVANVGEEIANKVEVKNNDPYDPSEFLKCGTTSRGTPLHINKRFMETDFKIATGNIVLCGFAGWTGGCKTVLPGISSKETIRQNHLMGVQTFREIDGCSYAGVIENNETRLDIEEAGKLAGLNMIINTVLDIRKKPVSIISGPPIKAHRAGVESAVEMYKVKVTKKPDLIIAGVGAYGFESSLYQGSYRSLQCLDRIIKPGGKIILVNECREGLYEGIEKEKFRIWMFKMPEPEDVIRLAESGEIPPEEVPPLYTFSYFIRKLECQLSIVTKGVSEDILRRAHMKHYNNLQRAVDQELANLNGNCKIIVVPYAGLTLLA